MTGEQIVALTKQHTLYEWSAQAAVDPIPVARAEGIYFWTPEGKRFIDFNSQLMCVNIGHGDPRVIDAIQRAGRDAGLRQPVHGDRAAGAAGREAGRARARRHRRLLLHQRRRRGQRERDQARAPVHRPAQDPGALPLLPRRHRRQPSRSPATRAAGPPSRACRASSTCRDPYHGIQRGWDTAADRAGPPRGGHRARGPADHRRHHHRDRSPAPTASWCRPTATCEGVRALCDQARHPADLRRGDGRLRPHRRVVRGRPLEGGARHHDHGQGADQLLRAARRGGHAPRHRRALQGERLLRRPDLQQPSARLRRGAGHHPGLRGGQPDRERARGWAQVMRRLLDELAAQAPLGRRGALASACSASSSWCATRRRASRWRPSTARRPRWQALGALLPRGGALHLRPLEHLLHQPAALHHRSASSREAFAIIDEGLTRVDAAIASAVTA